MAKKTDATERIDAALLEMAQDFRGSFFSEKLSADLTEKITMRILNKEGAAKPADLSPAEIRKLRERANMSQAVIRALPQRNHWLRLATRARRQTTHRPDARAP